MEAKTTSSGSKALQELLIAFNLVNSNPHQYCLNSSLKIQRIEKTTRLSSNEILNSLKGRFLLHVHEFSNDESSDALRSLKEKILTYLKFFPDKNLNEKSIDKKVEELFKLIKQKNPLSQLLSKSSHEISEQEFSTILFPFLNNTAREKACANMFFLMITADVFVQLSLEEFQTTVTPLIVDSTHENKQTTLFCPKYITSLIPPQSAEEASIAFSLEKASKQNGGIALDKIAQFSRESETLCDRSNSILKAWQYRQIMMLSGKFYSYLQGVIDSTASSKEHRIPELANFFSLFSEYIKERMSISWMLHANRMPYVHNFLETMIEQYQKYKCADQKYNELYKSCYDKYNEVLAIHTEYAELRAHQVLEKTLPTPEEFCSLTVPKTSAKEIIDTAYNITIDKVTKLCTEPETVLYEALTSCIDTPEDKRARNLFIKNCCNPDTMRNVSIKSLFIVESPSIRKNRKNPNSSLTAHDLNEFLPKSVRTQKKKPSAVQPKTEKTHHKRPHKKKTLPEPNSELTPVDRVVEKFESLSIRTKQLQDLPEKTANSETSIQSDSPLLILGIEIKEITLHSRVERWFTDENPRDWDDGYASLTNEDVSLEKIFHSSPGYISQIILAYGLKSHWHSKTSKKDGIRFSIPGEISICDPKRCPVKTFPGVFSDCYDKNQFLSNDQYFLYHHYFVTQSFETTLKEFQNKGRYISLNTINDGKEVPRKEQKETHFLDDGLRYILELHTSLYVSIYDTQDNIRYTACLS